MGDNGPNVGDFGNLRSISNRAAASSIAVVVGDSGEVEEEGGEEEEEENGIGVWGVLYVKCCGEMDAAAPCPCAVRCAVVNDGPCGRGTEAVMVGVPNGLVGPIEDDDDDSRLIGWGCRLAGGVEVTSIGVVAVVVSIVGVVASAVRVNAPLLLLL